MFDNKEKKDELQNLYLKLHKHYTSWKDGFITKEEYLSFVRPLDERIRELEMLTLVDTPVFEKLA